MSGTDRQARTTELLRSALDTHPGDDITLGDVLDPLGERAFGFLILILALPNFIPVPLGVGGPMGVLVAIIGAQMLFGLEHPWLLGSLRRRGIKRATLERFVRRLTPVLGWLERLCRPRWEALTRHPGHRVTGLLLVLVGIALALPIPFTNYPFGFLLVIYAVALIERDGIALMIAWLASIAVAVMLMTLSHAIVDTIRNLF
ncbi:MAG TPA: exopolysaccharide biosynthesis protein [Rhodanobacteraceae bacterium]|nr:exopolysaccharide biosynthesis protein [Rhodanobacteraceae bacterium]